MVIQLGDVFWVHIRPPVGSEPGYKRPCVIVQSDVYTQTRIRTVVVCPLTKNLRLGGVPGNVTLSKGEANIPKKSVINVTQILTVDKTSLGSKLGRISSRRMKETLAGICQVLDTDQLARLEF